MTIRSIPADRKGARDQRPGRLPDEDERERSGIFLNRASASFRQSPVGSASSAGRLSDATTRGWSTKASDAGVAPPGREAAAPERGSKNELAP